MSKTRVILRQTTDPPTTSRRTTSQFIFLADTRLLASGGVVDCYVDSYGTGEAGAHSGCPNPLALTGWPFASAMS